MSEEKMNTPVRKVLMSVMMAGTLISWALSGCVPVSETNVRSGSTPKNSVKKTVGERISLPGGAGVLLKDKQVVLIPQNTENKEQYETRLKDINAYAKQTGYTFVSIIDPENKMAYDAAMMAVYPKLYGKMYNMLENPISSWASMQIGGAEFVKRYTPNDILKAMVEAKKETRTL